MSKNTSQDGASAATPREMLEAILTVCERTRNNVPTAFAYAPKVYQSGITAVEAFVVKMVQGLEEVQESQPSTAPAAQGDARCQICGWKDEDHGGSEDQLVCPNQPPEALWDSLDAVANALPEPPEDIAPSLPGAVAAVVNRWQEAEREAEKYRGILEQQQIEATEKAAQQVEPSAADQGMREADLDKAEFFIQLLRNGNWRETAAYMQALLDEVRHLREKMVPTNHNEEVADYNSWWVNLETGGMGEPANIDWKTSQFIRRVALSAWLARAALSRSQEAPKPVPMPADRNHVYSGKGLHTDVLFHIADLAALRSLTPPSPAPASPPPVSQETRPMKLVAKAIGDSFNLRWVNLEGREVVANYGIPSRVAQELAHRNNSFEATPDPREGAGEGRQG